MRINIPPDLEKFIYRQLSSGRFARAEDVLRAALSNLDTLDLFDSCAESSTPDASKGGVQPGKAAVERLPEFFTNSDDTFVPGDIPMPKGRFIHPDKGGSRLPEFHGIS